jgi:hypothetical protein
MKIYVICPTRTLDKAAREYIERAVYRYEVDGNEVYFPPRDMNPYLNTEFEKCQQNMGAIADADEIWVFYHKKSLGSHFDMGMAFALGKPIQAAEIFKKDNGYTRGEFVELLDQWYNTRPSET